MPLQSLQIAQHILSAYGLEDKNTRIEAFGSGLINRTWKISALDKEYILQQVNMAVFKEPAKIAHNIRLIAAYLKEHAPSYLFVSPIVSLKGEDMVFDKEQGFFRLFPFVAGSHSKDVVTTPGEAFEAAIQFGRFTRLLSGLDVSELKITIPHFHDLGLRYEQFLTALKKGNKERINDSKGLIEKIISNADIVAEYRHIRNDREMKQRVTHHDTKISNVLFNKEGKGVCVIDLDTVMPGYFISDVGDMMRTYLSPVSEEEGDFSKIDVRDDFYKAIVEGYFEEMKDELTDKEKTYFSYAGKFMIYMQAVRFLTDHLNNDTYYGAKYEGQNFVRAGNQVTLLQCLLEYCSLLT